MRLQENGEVWVSWFVGYFIRIISSVGYHPKYSERWGVSLESTVLQFEYLHECKSVTMVPSPSGEERTALNVALQSTLDVHIAIQDD